MKIILIIPCVLSVLGATDVVDAAEQQLRGSNRELQFDFGSFFNSGGNPPSNIFSLTSPYSMDPTKASPNDPNDPDSIGFTSTYTKVPQPDKPSQISEDNAFFSGNSPFGSSSDSSFFQQPDPADPITSGGGFGGDNDFANFGGFSGGDSFDFVGLLDGESSFMNSFDTTGDSP
jgi:hypothetical protein